MLGRPFSIGHAPCPVLPSPSVRAAPRQPPGQLHGAAVGLTVAISALRRTTTLRRASEASKKINGEASLEKGLRKIVAQLRKLESISSAYNQMGTYGFPAKSTPTGLAAMNDLDQLVNGEVELDNKEMQLLVASLQNDKSDFGELVIDTLEVLKGEKEEPDLTGSQEIIDLLHANGFSQELDEIVWPLPPSESDSSPNAQNARWPILPALEQSCQDGRSLGLAEAEKVETEIRVAEPKAMKLEKLLEQVPGAQILMKISTEITGVVDILDRAISGDLLLVEAVDGDILEEAEAKQVAAVVVLGDSDWKQVKRTFEDFYCEGSVKAIATMPKTVEDLPTAVHLARSFFGSAGNVKKIAVVGDDHLEVRSASWLLFKMLEVHAGASKTGFINERCSLIAQRNLGIFGTLTPCTVEEILAGMNEQGVELCVAEVLPSSDSFDHLDFDLVLHLDGEIRIFGKEVISPKEKAKAQMVWEHTSLVHGAWCIQHFFNDVSIWSFQSIKIVTAPKSTALFHLQASYGYEVARLGSSLEDYAKLTKDEVFEELLRRGVEMSESSSKKELLEQLATLEVVESPESPSMEIDQHGQHLHGQFTSVGLGGVELKLKGLGLAETGLTLPSLGLCPPRSLMAAMCAAQVLGVFESSLAGLTSIPPPCASLEMVGGHSGSGGVGVLHEAKSPSEVTEALEKMKEIMTNCGDPKAKFTVVFGCDGEVSRGDRAKYAWALAEHCDRIVLTSSSPGVEPPMQIIEDILEAIQGFRSWKSSSKKHLELFVISDRADALKLACTPKRDGAAPDVTMVFGSGYRDSYEATDHLGQVSSWLFHDRRILTEALQLAEDIRMEGTVPPWQQSTGGRKFVLPGRSLHWSYGIEISSDGQMREFL